MDSNAVKIKMFLIMESSWQEFLGAYFVVETTKEDPDYIEKRFPTMKHVVDHNVVLQFCCGLLLQDTEENPDDEDKETTMVRHDQASKVLIQKG